MPHYVVEPEVAGGFGDRTLIDRSTGRIVVQRLHYVFDGWLGDELLESTPCYIASEHLAQQIEQAKLTGVTFGPVDVSGSEQFHEFHRGLQLPRFLWLQVVGTAGRDDFGVTSDLRLVVSHRALDVLHSCRLANATVEPFEQ